MRVNMRGIIFCGSFFLLLAVPRPVSAGLRAAPGAITRQVPRVRSTTLRAAAGKVDITPDLKRETVWLAGFGAKGRKPSGIHDPLYARALVVSDGEKTVALVAVDCIGIYREDVERMRRLLGWTGGQKYLFVSATHTHSGPDTLGLWGRFPAVSGVDSRYHERVIESVAGLVRDLSGRLREADIAAAKKDIDPRGLCKDSRAPVVIDPELDVVQLRPKARRSGPPIATLVRWSCHPEVAWDDNFMLTADYPGALCGRIERETGGACVFQSGLIGGLMTPEADRTGGIPQEYREIDRIGGKVAGEALAALRKSPWHASGSVDFDREIVRIPVENSTYLLFLPNLTFGHRLLDAGGRPLSAWETHWLPLRHLLLFPLPERLRPWVETEVSSVRVGPVQFLGIPGEMFPELAIGGYDGRYRFGHPLIAPDNPNPPKLSLAPRGPYLRKKLKAEVAVLVGLANDELGYFVPAYDFQATPSRFMYPHPPGNHYEETNSIGPTATGIILQALDDLTAPGAITRQVPRVRSTTLRAAHSGHP